MAITLDGTAGVTIGASSNYTFGDTSTQGTAANSGNFAFKNRIINGAMVISQRNAGASQTITAAAALAYTVDRWYAYCTGANVTGQQIAGTYASSQYLYQFTGAASVTAIGFGQRIEQKNCYDLANATATLSCYISNSLLTSVTWTAYYATSADSFGTLASPTRTQIATGTFTVSSTRTRYTASISVPTAATTGIEIVFTVGAQTSGTWIIDSVQLEKNPVATAFDVRPYGTELALCQRYCNVIKPGTSASGIFAGVWYTTTSALCAYIYPVVMRAAPTLTISAASDFIVVSGGNADAASAVNMNGTGTTSTRIDITSSVARTSGHGALVQTANSSASLTFSAEL